MTYLVIDLKVSKASMLQSIDFIAPAPVFAAVMAMHALDMELGKRRQGLGVQGVGLVHRHCAPWIEYLEKKGGWLDPYLVQRRGAYQFDSVKTPQGTPLQPDALADLEWALLLDCQAHVSAAAAPDIETQLLRMRLAGGNILSAKVRAHEQWDAALGALGSGFWIDDASDLLCAQPDPMLALLQATRSGAWIVPANLGYALLEVPQEQRRGARDAKPHAFAEHMIGLLRYTPVRAARKQDENQEGGLLPTHLWRHGWDGDQFLVSNRADLSLNTSPTTPA
ncbi:MAG: hypothetical protein Q7T22_03185 [Serpentinimonas sp.]|nr:hypothetical protein [Serpentinimonas sp.]MDO9610840.1 hypothetical protein [Serpentinimonas sp.]